MGLLQHTAALLGRGEWAVGLLVYTASLPGSRGLWMTFCTLPHCKGALHSGSPSAQCRSARGQWAVGLLHYSASLLGSSGQWISFGTLPHCWGSNGQCDSFITLPHC